MQVDAISRFARIIYPELVELRRDLHRHPELSGAEERTAQVVAEFLEELGLEVRTGVGGHGVVGLLRGTKSEPVVAYRADMDALDEEIYEDHEFASQVTGASHCCGHDVHTTIALGTAQVLSAIRDELPGTIKFIFQPAEESLEGAEKMLADGVLDDEPPLAIFALHIAPFETGQIAVNPGLGLPGLVEYTLKFEGEGALKTARKVEKGVNKLGTVHYPENDRETQKFFEDLVANATEPQPFILTMGFLDDDAADGDAAVRGFIKASSDEEYEIAQAEILRTTSELGKPGVKISCKFDRVLPDMVCDEVLALWAVGPLQEALGEGNVVVSHRTTPFSGEDFACFLKRIPGVMFFLGGSNTEAGIHAIQHSPHFAVDEHAILVGTVSMANLLYRYLVGY